MIVITGIHHSFHAVEAGLLGNPNIGVNFYCRFGQWRILLKVVLVLLFGLKLKMQKLKQSQSHQVFRDVRYH